MARPIETTPVLTGRSAARFDRLIKNCTYRPTPKRRINRKEIDRILADLQKAKEAREREREAKPSE